LGKPTTKREGLDYGNGERKKKRKRIAGMRGDEKRCAKLHQKKKGKTKKPIEGSQPATRSDAHCVAENPDTGTFQRTPTAQGIQRQRFRRGGVFGREMGEIKIRRAR